MNIVWYMVSNKLISLTSREKPEDIKAVSNVVEGISFQSINFPNE